MRALRKTGVPSISVRVAAAICPFWLITFQVFSQLTFREHRWVCYRRVFQLRRSWPLPEVPFADASFDFVLCWGVLHYLVAETVPDALSEILRVLKPGGRVFLTLRSDADTHLRRQLQTGDLASGHAQLYSKPDALQLFTGFTENPLRLYRPPAARRRGPRRAPHDIRAEMKGARVKQIRGRQTPACPVCASGSGCLQIPHHPAPLRYLGLQRLPL
jgi:SAM-dependent methyltransferase